MCIRDRDSGVGFRDSESSVTFDSASGWSNDQVFTNIDYTGATQTDVHPGFTLLYHSSNGGDIVLGNQGAVSTDITFPSSRTFNTIFMGTEQPSGNIISTHGLSVTIEQLDPDDTDTVLATATATVRVRINVVGSVISENVSLSQSLTGTHFRITLLRITGAHIFGVDFISLRNSAPASTNNTVDAYIEDESNTASLDFSSLRILDINNNIQTGEGRYLVQYSLDGGTTFTDSDTSIDPNNNTQSSQPFSNIDIQNVVFRIWAIGTNTFHGLRISAPRTFVFLDSSGTICVSEGGDTHAIASLNATEVSIDEGSYNIDCRDNINFIIDRTDEDSGDGNVVLTNPLIGKRYRLKFTAPTTGNYAGISFTPGESDEHTVNYSGSTPNINADTTSDVVEYEAFYITNTWYVTQVATFDNTLT